MVTLLFRTQSYDFSAERGRLLCLFKEKLFHTRQLKFFALAGRRKKTDILSGPALRSTPPLPHPCESLTIFYWRRTWVEGGKKLSRTW